MVDTSRRSRCRDRLGNVAVSLRSRVNGFRDESGGILYPYRAVSRHLPRGNVLPFPVFLPVLMNGIGHTFDHYLPHFPVRFNVGHAPADMDWPHNYLPLRLSHNRCESIPAGQ
jgi:hypothetical protein